MHALALRDRLSIVGLCFASLILLPSAARADFGEILLGPRPVVDSFMPGGGLPGTVVTITGSEFNNVLAVSFGGQTATFTVLSSTTIEATVPEDALSGPVNVATIYGTSINGTFFFVGRQPEITDVSPLMGGPGTPVIIRGQYFDLITQVSFNGGSASFDVIDATEIHATVPLTAASGSVTVTNPAGTAASSQSFTVVGPQIAQISPTIGTVGYAVTITGQYFTYASQVRFNLSPASFTVVNDGTIQATVPNNATSGPITVSNPGMSGVSAQSFTVVGPQITQVNPPQGTLGTPVTITGQYFTSTTSVKFNGTAASFTLVNDTQITTSVPSGASSGAVTVTNPAGTGSSPQPFTVFGPEISQISPTQGTLGNSVEITGQYLGPATQVTFNGAPAPFTVVNDTRITTTVPGGATTGPVTVTSPVGTGASPQTFTVVGPAISQINPTVGTVGYSVEITGQYLGPATQVRFNGTSAAFSVVNDSRITATVPVGASTGPVTVTSPVGTSASPQPFTVVGPVITQINPTQAPIGAPVQIIGQYFTSTTSVAFNGSNAAFTVLNDALIQATVPATATLGFITVTNPVGTATSPQTFAVTPALDGFEPARVPASQRDTTRIVLYGHSFTNAYSVQVNGLPAVFTVESDTQIRMQIPAGDVHGVIQVTSPQGLSISVARFRLTDPLVPPATPGFAWPHDYATYVAASSIASVKANHSSVSDGLGGAISVWTDQRSGILQVYAQRITAQGAVAPGWPVDGLRVAPNGSVQTTPVAVADGDGGVLIAWRDYRSDVGDIYAQHVLGNGLIEDGWPALGLAVGAAAGEQSNPAIASDGAYGAHVAWQDRRSDTNGDIYAVRITAIGALAHGWTAGGVPINTQTNSQTTPTVADDGFGGALIAFTNGVTGNAIYVQRRRSDGSIATGWGANGVPAINQCCNQSAPQIMGDGTGGAFVAWQDSRCNILVFLNRLTPTGSTSPGWNPAGTVLGTACRAGTADGIRLASDAQGGLYAAWRDAPSQGNISIQRVDGSGLIHDGWPASAVALTTDTFDQSAPSLIADAVGAYVAWQDRRAGNYDIYAARVVSNGIVHPAWTSAGMRVCSLTGDQTLSGLVPGAGGTALVSWHDQGGGTNDKIRSQLLDGSGRLGNPSPMMTQVIDVPNDDGGQVRIKWNASYLDVIPTLEIGDYGIWREVTAEAMARAVRAGARLYGAEASGMVATPGVYRELATANAVTYWEGVGSIPARGQSLYSFAAPSLADSSDLGTFDTSYMIDAHAAFFPYFWDAQPLSGHSVDNFPPAAPQGFAAVAALEGVSLHWSANSELDLRDYRVHRGIGNFPVDPTSLIATVGETAYFDPNGVAGATYKLVAVDVHGNASDPTVTQTQLPVGVLDPVVPTVLFMDAGVPNPVRERCVFRLGLPRSQPVRLAIFDLSGRLVRKLADQEVPAGIHDMVWDGRDGSGHPVSSGVFMARLEADGRRITRRVVRLR